MKGVPANGMFMVRSGCESRGGAGLLRRDTGILLRKNGVGKKAAGSAIRTDEEKTELELSGLDPDALSFMRAGERRKILKRAGLDPAKYDF